MGRVVLALLALATLPAFAGERLNVTIVKREPIEWTATGQVSGSFSANSSTNCISSSCSTTTTGYVEAPATISRTIRGARLTLQLPDGRRVVVACDGRYAPRGDYINLRSCRVPPVDEVQVKFNRRGTKATIYWPASFNGKKFESEKYEFLAQEP